MTTTRIQQTIKPNSNCPHCHGSGKVTDWVDYGPTQVQIESYCACVEAQAEEDTLEQTIEIVLDNSAYLKAEAESDARYDETIRMAELQAEESMNATEREAAFMDYAYWH